MNNVIIAPNGQIIPFMPKNGKKFSLKELKDVVGGEIQTYQTRDKTRLMVMNFNGANIPSLKPNPTASQFVMTETRVSSSLVGNIAVIDANLYQNKYPEIPELKDRTSIYITEEADFINLIDWKNSNYPTRDYTQFLKEGVIYLWSGIAIYFREAVDPTGNPATYYLICDLHNNSTVTYSFFRSGTEHVVVEKNYTHTDSETQKFIRAMSFIHAALMDYMAKNVTIKQRVKKSTKTGGITKVTGSNGKSRFIPLQRVRYEINIADQQTPTDRKNERKTLGWEVAGHIRRYRDSDGEVVKETFVKPHVKGDPNKVQPKKYKF